MKECLEYRISYDKIDFNDAKIIRQRVFVEEQGFEKKEIVKRIAKDRKVNKNEIYQYFIK